MTRPRWFRSGERSLNGPSFAAFGRGLPRVGRRRLDHVPLPATDRTVRPSGSIRWRRRVMPVRSDASRTARSAHASDTRREGLTIEPGSSTSVRASRSSTGDSGTYRPRKRRMPPGSTCGVGGSTAHAPIARRARPSPPRWRGAGPRGTTSRQVGCEQSRPEVHRERPTAAEPPGRSRDRPTCGRGGGRARAERKVGAPRRCPVRRRPRVPRHSRAGTTATAGPPSAIPRRRSPRRRPSSRPGSSSTQPETRTRGRSCIGIETDASPSCNRPWSSRVGRPATTALLTRPGAGQREQTVVDLDVRGAAAAANPEVAPPPVGSRSKGRGTGREARFATAARRARDTSAHVSTATPLRVPRKAMNRARGARIRRDRTTRCSTRRRDDRTPRQRRTTRRGSSFVAACRSERPLARLLVASLSSFGAASPRSKPPARMSSAPD